MLDLERVIAARPSANDRNVTLVLLSDGLSYEIELCFDDFIKEISNFYGVSCTDVRIRKIEITKEN
jgi:hypothetical protein